MLELKKVEIIKKERKFTFIYVNFKAEAQFVRTKLKQKLGEMIIAIDKNESELKQKY